MAGSSSSCNVSSYSCAPCTGSVSPCSNSDSLNIFKRQLYQGDYEIVGVGTRDTGKGTINLTQVPSNAHVVEAYLYWNTIGPPCVDAISVFLNQYDCAIPVDCTVTVSCGSCPTKMPQWWSLTASGAANGTCSGCTALNGTFNLKWVGGCVWQTDQVTTCPSGGPLWMLSFDPVESAWFITANGSDESGDAVYNVSGTFNCVGNNTFTLHLSDPACTFPATLTITPVINFIPCGSSGSSGASIGPAATVYGTCIGVCGDSCWLQFADSTCSDGAAVAQPIVNRVYRANVTGIVTQNGPYCVSGLPFDPLSPFCPGSPDHTRYPGCGGSEGAALLVIWEYNVGQGPMDQTRYREVSIYDGAVLITGPGSQPIFGGVTTYSVNHNTAYFQNCKIGWGVGDAQAYPDHASFNNTILNSGPSFFNPDQGNLLSAKTMTGVTGQTDNSFTVFDLPNDTDCLTWFLYAQSGNGCSCRISADLIGSGQGFVANGFYAQSLNCQTLTVQQITDNCPCVPLTNGWQVNINGTGWVNVPMAGLAVKTGDLVDLRINPANTCGLCTNSGPYCIVPTT
jgi:hypothetical protein